MTAWRAPSTCSSSAPGVASCWWHRLSPGQLAREPPDRQRLPERDVRAADALAPGGHATPSPSSAYSTPRSALRERLGETAMYHEADRQLQRRRRPSTCPGADPRSPTTWVEDIPAGRATDPASGRARRQLSLLLKGPVEVTLRRPDGMERGSRSSMPGSTPASLALLAMAARNRERRRRCESPVRAAELDLAADFDELDRRSPSFRQDVERQARPRRGPASRRRTVADRRPSDQVFREVWVFRGAGDPGRRGHRGGGRHRRTDDAGRAILQRDMQEGFDSSTPAHAVLGVGRSTTRRSARWRRGTGSPSPRAWWTLRPASPWGPIPG